MPAGLPGADRDRLPPSSASLSWRRWTGRPARSSAPPAASRALSAPHLP